MGFQHATTLFSKHSFQLFKGTHYTCTSHQLLQLLTQICYVS